MSRKNSSFYLSAKESAELDALVVQYQTEQHKNMQDLYFLRIVEYMSRRLHISNVSGNITENISDHQSRVISCFNYTILAALKGFDASKGSFIQRFNLKYKEEMSRLRREDGVTTGDEHQHDFLCEYVQPLVSDLYPYMEQNLSSKQSDKPLRKTSYLVYSKEIVGETTWYQINSQEQNVYVPASDNLYHAVCTKQALIAGDDDSDEPEIIDIPDDASRLGDSITTEMLDSFVFSTHEALSLFLQMYKNDPCPEGVSQSNSTPSLRDYHLYQMVYTDYLIKSLKELSETGVYHGYRHETMLMNTTDSQWKDYLMTKICNDFSSIIATKLHSFHHFLNNHDNKELTLPAPFSVRSRYLLDHYEIKRTMDSLEVEVSKRNSAFKKKYQSTVAASLRA